MRRHHHVLPTSVDIIVPYRPDGGLRDEHFAILSSMWDRWFPTANVRVGVHTEAEGMWNKAVAIDRALEGSTAEVIVIADADVWCEPEFVAQAVRQVSNNTPWVVPHQMVHRLDEKSSERWASGDVEGPQLRYDRRPYLGVVGGGLLVITREKFDRIGRFDPGFVGHSGEDISFGYKADTLLGVHTRLKGRLIHLYHVPQATKGTRHSEANMRRMREYALARHKPHRMRELAAEYRVS